MEAKELYQINAKIKKVSQEWIKPGHRNGQNKHVT